MILLNISERSKVQVYLHWSHYPSAKLGQHDVCLGDLPAQVLQKMLSNQAQMDQFTEEAPYAYDEEANELVHIKDMERQHRL